MYAQAATKPNSLLRNGAYGIVMRGVQKCTRGCSSLRGKNRLPLCCIKLDTATDPCMGSGHILVYAFDVLIQIYKKAGFSERDAAQSILENNLYGLDIDDRAAQLAYFAVMMKARQYDRRIFSRNIQPHVYAIVESNDVQIPAMWRLGPEKEIAEKLIAELKDWNPRLYSQKGAFFITGNKIKPEGVEAYTRNISRVTILPELVDLPSTITNSRGIRVIRIPAANKRDILQILQEKGVTAKTLHLEMETKYDKPGIKIN